MSDDVPPPYIYEGVDGYNDRKTSSVSDTFMNAAQRISEAFDHARKPGMPLSVLTNVAREAPLGSLLAAFLVGVAVARRR